MNGINVPEELTADPSGKHDLFSERSLWKSFPDGGGK